MSTHAGPLLLFYFTLQLFSDSQSKAKAITNFAPIARHQMPDESCCEILKELNEAVEKSRKSSSLHSEL